MLKRKHLKAVITGTGFMFLTLHSFAHETHLTRYHTFSRLPLSPGMQDTLRSALAEDTSLLFAPEKNNVLQVAEKTALVVKLKAPVVKLHPQAMHYVKGYIKKNENHLLQIEAKRGKYFTLMDSVFCMYDLPVQLKYLAVVESELKASATSRVGAGGPWQLMPATARLLGLKICGKKDERSHYFKSTMAAARYLKILHTQYKDWLLVIAAYNCGPGTVNKAIRYAGTRNFWRLQQHLPAETRNHVKRYISTHYFFEGEGGVTTVTGSEAIAYTKAKVAFAEALKAAIPPVAASTPLPPTVDAGLNADTEATVPEVVLHAKSK